MPVTKYRSVADMPPPARSEPAELAARIRAVWNRSRRMCALRPVPGVVRFPSIEAASAAREQATIARMRQAARRT